MARRTSKRSCSARTSVPLFWEPAILGMEREPNSSSRYPPVCRRLPIGGRLTITLTWLTPTNSTRQNYRVAHLWFNPKQDNKIAQGRLYADHNAVQRGTVQHEVLEGTNAVPFQDGTNILIKVNCRSDAGDITEPIRYALAVTLEVAEGIDIPVYQEIQNRLAVRVQV